MSILNELSASWWSLVFHARWQSAVGDGLISYLRGQRSRQSRLPGCR
jgi:hypothetical protein